MRVERIVGEWKERFRAGRMRTRTHPAFHINLLIRLFNRKGQEAVCSWKSRPTAVFPGTASLGENL